MQYLKKDKKMNKKKQSLSLSFSKIESLEEVKDTNNTEKSLDIQECFCLKSPKGHQSNWVEVYANFSALETLDGFQEGLRKLHANSCANLETAVGLPASCKEAYFDGSGVHALYVIDQSLYTATHMTAGLELLSLRNCSNLYTLRGIAPTCKTVKIDETSVISLKELPNGIENVSATWCKHLKTTEGLPASCQYLDLSFSAIETLKDIPADIKEVRVYNCNNLKKECLKSVPVCVLPRIKGLSADAAQYAEMLIVAAHKKQRRKRALQSQKVRG